MKNIKRGLIGTIIGAVLLGGLFVIAPDKGEQGMKFPVIDKVIEEHTPIAGKKQSFIVTSKYSDKVQYKLWFQGANGKWHENPYSEPVDAKTPAVITSKNIFEEGKNNIIIWVKEAGTEGEIVKEIEEGRNIGYDNCYLSSVVVP